MLHFLTQEVQPACGRIKVTASVTDPLVHAVVESFFSSGSAFMKFRFIQFNLHKIKKEINCCMSSTCCRCREERDEIEQVKNSCMRSLSSQ